MHRITEFPWNVVRSTLPEVSKQQASTGKVVVLGECVVDERQKKVLSLGPKFCSEPGLGPVHRLALALTISSKAHELEKARCVGEAAGVVASNRGRVPSKVRMNSLANDLVAKGIGPLLSDKEGSFVLMTEGTFLEKATRAVDKNLKKVKEKPMAIKKRAVSLLEGLNLN
ncbi:hypothetical protein HPB52_007834 [Rhipicephalus sanguineus]|uniref:Uncharacterized protein n=1 Tax=Rhipicephalus sanguineus TaxID=34632 RepID=A0A9D4Q9Y0_RHISA|nr:hypothetical protein HPB52_007834 [Rhipicephalus sanguineus]